MPAFTESQCSLTVSVHFSSAQDGYVCYLCLPQLLAATCLHSVSYITRFFWHPLAESPAIQTQDSWLSHFPLLWIPQNLCQQLIFCTVTRYSWTSLILNQMYRGFLYCSVLLFFLSTWRKVKAIATAVEEKEWCADWHHGNTSIVLLAMQTVY